MNIGQVAVPQVASCPNSRPGHVHFRRFCLVSDFPRLFSLFFIVTPAADCLSLLWVIRCVQLERRPERASVQAYVYSLWTTTTQTSTRALHELLVSCSPNSDDADVDTRCTSCLWVARPAVTTKTTTRELHELVNSELLAEQLESRPDARNFPYLST